MNKKITIQWTKMKHPMVYRTHKKVLPVDGVAQIDVHWTIRGEYFRRNFIVFR